MIHFTEKILIAGHKSTEGSAIERQLLRLGHPRSHILHDPMGDFDWCNAQQTEAFLRQAMPDQIYLPAAPFLQCGDPSSLQAVLAKTNLSNIITCSARVGIPKLLLLVGSEVYPSSRLPPYAEEDLTGGPIGGHKTFSALTQLWAMKYCQEISVGASESGEFDFRCAVVGATYGPGHESGPHVRRLVPQLITQIEHAKAHALGVVHIALEQDDMLDLLFIDDFAEACVYLMEIPRHAIVEQRHASHHHINIAHGRPVSAQKLAQSLANSLGYFGTLSYSPSGNDDLVTARNLDPTRLAHLGWTPMMDIDQGVEIVCADYQLHRHNRIKTP